MTITQIPSRPSFLLVLNPNTGTIMWIIILTVCKFAGILITGIAGIISQLSEEHRGKIQSWILQLATRLYNDNRDRAQTIASKVSNAIKRESCVAWAIFGVVVALISQSVETLKASHDDKESKKRTESQLRTAQKSLDYLEKLSTRFDSLSVEVKFELDRNSKDFSALYDFADRFLSSMNLTNSLTPATEATIKPSLQLFSRLGYYLKTRSAENKFGYKYKESPARYFNVNVHSNTSVTVQMFFSEDDNTVQYWPMETNDLFLLCQFFSTNAVSPEALRFIQRPWFDLGLFSAKTKNLDLSISVTNANTPPILIYNLKARKFYIDCAFDCPKADWKQTKWMMSLPDLADATFIISTCEVRDAGIRPLEGELAIDLISIPLTNFTRIIYSDCSQFRCVLPDKQQILGTK